MFFKNKSKKQKNKFYKTGPSKYRLNRWDYLLVGLTFVVGLFVVSVAQRWGADPVAESSHQPALPEILRVQVLNACGVKNVGDRVKAKIQSRNPTDFYYFDVVDKANFKAFDIQESFVAFQAGGQEDAAAELCRVLGLPANRIVQQEFGDNFMEFDLKVIVGQDNQGYLRKE
ncbi:MAG: hypothetical protein A2Z27_06285 [candidate division Zixibacteria bacterium RBG_16_50_21]|nr:MAG: hypothetical protein A2Z27_06285 [candidate division Zixibacteria bacterium RBG_16_50_21]